MICLGINLLPYFKVLMFLSDYEDSMYSHSPWFLEIILLLTPWLLDNYFFSKKHNLHPCILFSFPSGVGANTVPSYQLWCKRKLPWKFDITEYYPSNKYWHWHRNIILWCKWIESPWKTYLWFIKRSRDTDAHLHAKFIQWEYRPVYLESSDSRRYIN